MRVYGNKEEQTKQRQKKGKLGKLYISYRYIALIPIVPSLISQRRSNYFDYFVYQETLEQKSNGTKFALWDMRDISATCWGIDENVTIVIYARHY